MSWEALGAISTTVAVVLALWPAIDTWLKGRAVAANVRSQLLAHFTALRPTVARRFTNTGLGTQTNQPLSEKELEPLRAIEALVPQTTALSSEEHDLVMAAFTNLILMKAMPEIVPKTGNDVLALIDQVRSKLQEGSWLRGKSISLPWHEKDVH